VLHSAPCSHSVLTALALVIPFALVRSPASDAPGAAAPQSPPPALKALRFSGIPTQNTTELAAKYAPLAAHLTKTLGVPVEYVPSADYDASVNGFVNGDVQLCWFGGFTGVQARERVPAASVIACGKVDRAFKSYFVANVATK
jgi:phosphonate transport system substrate-binding protein